MSEKLSDLMFQFIVDKGLRSEWDVYFEEHQEQESDYDKRIRENEEDFNKRIREN